LHRIERIAAQVHRTLQRPAEHPPVTFPEDETPGGVTDPEATEALWDKLYKHNRRQQERLQRALEERRSRGEDEDRAFEKALDDLGLEAPDEESGAADEQHEDQSRSQTRSTTSRTALVPGKRKTFRSRLRRKNAIRFSGVRWTS